MKDLILISGPTAEPVSVSDMLTQLGYENITDSTLSASLQAKLGGYITAARRKCEGYMRRALLTQTWLLKLDGFPGSDWTYEWEGYPAIVLPFPPTQSIDFVRYVDTSGTVQTLTLDTSYGNSSLQYCYQFARGGETQAARLLSGWARPWPPTRLIPANVLVQFRCGFGGPLTCSVQAGSAVLTTPGFQFNPDDMPVLTGDTGIAVTVPGAGANGADLVTNVQSVDANGVATLAVAATTTQASAAGWLGQQVPQEIVQAIQFLTQFYYEQGSVVDQPLPRIVCDLLDFYVVRGS